MATRSSTVRLLALVAVVVGSACGWALTGMAGSAGATSARASSAQYCRQVPLVGGIPPWGFHTGAPITGATGSFARGHGEINLAANTVSGILCQVDRLRNQPDRLIIMTVEHHLVYHSHYAVMWGYPGNVMKIIVRVKSSTDPLCPAGTLGHVTLFASYNGVRSDSVQFKFPSTCSDHDHLYHGTQVNNQVPPA
jgi:hypothetical protein